MPTRLAGHVPEQSLGPGGCLALARFVRCHGGISSLQIATNNMRSGKVIQEATDPPPSDHGMQTFVHLGINGNRQLLLHAAFHVKLYVL
ncbi:MAG TPA: hypothetical protein VH855_30675, partial [Acetobacteraceae bacterium]